MSRAALSGLGEAERDALALALHHSSPAELLGRAAEALARSGTYGNLRVRSRKANIKKSDRDPTPEDF